MQGMLLGEWRAGDGADKRELLPNDKSEQEKINRSYIVFDNTFDYTKQAN